MVDFKPVDEETGEIPMSEPERLKAELESLQVKRDLEAAKLSFKNFEDFQENKQKYDDLTEKEKQVTIREELVSKREAEVEIAAKKNDAVKASIIAQDLENLKRRKAVIDYAMRHYFENLDTLFQKVYNAKSGNNCYGLVKRGKKYYDEIVACDTIFQDDCIVLIEQIMKVLSLSPKFSNDTGEYIRQDENIGEPEEL